MANVIMDSDGHASKKAKTHEAHLIPGLSSRVFGFPNSIITKLKYCDVQILTSTTGAVARQDYRANSIFDPDFTNTGHQPMWRDNYAAIYDQYVVIGSKITVQFTHVSAATTGVMVVGIHTDDDSSGSSNLTTMMELNNTVWRQIGPTGSRSDSCTLVGTFEPLEMFGVDAKDDGSSATAVGSTPSEEIYYQIFAANAPTNTSICEIAVEIEYTVKFSELTTQVQN